MKILPEQDQLVATFLNYINVGYSVQWLGVNGKDDSFADADKWRIIFNKAGKEKSFDFNTGSGNRYTKKDFSSVSKSFCDSVKAVTGLDNALIAASKGTKIDRQNNYVDSYAVTPTQASVLYCLLLDADCGSMSFDEFCDNCGYDTDSFKAFDIYKACMQVTKDINSLFTNSERQQLAELLQDY